MRKASFISVLAPVIMVVGLWSSTALAASCDWWGDCTPDWEELSSPEQQTFNAMGNTLLGAGAGAGASAVGISSVGASAIAGGVTSGASTFVPAGEVLYEGVGTMTTYEASEGQQMVDFWNVVVDWVCSWFD